MTIAACAALVGRGDPDRCSAVMAAPVAARAPLFVLYAFNLEVARAPWVSREPLLAEMRLQWWRDVVAADHRRAHEVAGPLHDLICAQALPVAVLDALIAARQWDVYRDPFAGAAALSEYLAATGGGLMWLAACALGAGPGAEAAARDLGWAAGLAGFLQAVPDLIARGRQPLPETGTQAVASLAAEGLDRLARARRGNLPRAAALTAWQVPMVLRRVARDPAAVAEGRMRLSEFDRRRRLAWQALTGRF